jgi:membrane-bound lytic murein transglycosylase A
MIAVAMKTDHVMPLARKNFLRHNIAAVFVTLLTACVSHPPAGVGKPVLWSALPGWAEEHPAQAWPALLNTCKKLSLRDSRWKGICTDAVLLAEPDDATARAFFETRFAAHELIGNDGATEGLITGYYEPLLHGSPVRTERFHYPLYRRPDDLLVVDLGELYPELAGKRVRGRLNGNRVVPYFSRAEITNGGKHLSGQELLWVDNPVALFFLQIQGSGRVQMPDGQTLYVGYADQNGHPYMAIGNKLIERGALKADEVNLQSIRAWLAAHPDEAETVLNSNPSYVFFAVRDAQLPGPLGALNVPLLPERAVAVDPAFVPLGAPVWLDTALPGSESKPYRRLTFAQDTGGAIKGAARADLFFGYGAEAERLAGQMKQRGRMYVFLPTMRMGEVEKMAIR